MDEREVVSLKQAICIVDRLFLNSDSMCVVALWFQSSLADKLSFEWYKRKRMKQLMVLGRKEVDD